MDCPSEEQIIKLNLQNFKNIKSMQFNLSSRILEVYHHEDEELILQTLHKLKLNTTLQANEQVPDDIFLNEEKEERQLFLWVFGINLSFFLIEIIAGVLANSMGLIADSLDMLADAIIFGISLFVVGAAISKKKLVAKISGYFQLTLALLGFFEIIRRFMGFDKMPDYKTMIFVSTFALIGNVVSLYIIQKAKSKNDAHIKAGRIFLSNDVAINIGVIVAGVLVLLLASNIPDLAIGSIVFLIVAYGAFRILQLAK